ncbi:IS5 family transposase [Altericista sp. CCNU0014]|uniref:IS5 family transposase n=1 Tax=Altericista sp. CCNU0014 TaxID=3082949 RepID=UPI00384BC78B
MKTQYRIRNWSEYNAALKQRGSLTFWVSEEALEQWLETEKTGQRGASRTYSNTAIEVMATLKAIYRWAGRQVEGFIESVFQLMHITLAVPDHSTLSRRMKTLEIDIPVHLSAKEGSVPGEASSGHLPPRHVVIDSTGVKVYGEGEWKTRQHGVSKRRTWRKLHLALDEATGEILAVVASGNHTADCEVLPMLLEQIEDEIEPVSADGAYDTRTCYEDIQQRGAKAIIPPRKGAKIWMHGNTKAQRHQRDENLRQIRRKGRKRWKQDSRYHRRSISETGMFRFKTTFGDRLSSRHFDNQATEMFVKCAALNRMMQLCKPDSYAVAA